MQPFVEISVTNNCEMDRTEGVFALKAIAANFVEALDRLRQQFPKHIVTVGGSCGTEAARVTYLNETYNGNMAIIWFDAHGDLNTPASSPSGHFHGMVLRTLLGNGPTSLVQHLRLPLMPKQVFLVGTRDLDVSITTLMKLTYLLPEARKLWRLQGSAFVPI
ncbi:MAG: arginase family protein [Terriglobales bacterium]